jgi:hypothetical protein
MVPGSRPDLLIINLSELNAINQAGGLLKDWAYLRVTRMIDRG